MHLLLLPPRLPANQGAKILISSSKSDKIQIYDHTIILILVCPKKRILSLFYIICKLLFSFYSSLCL